MMYTFYYVFMPNMTAGYGRFSDAHIRFWAFLYNTCLKRYKYKFIKLLQIDLFEKLFKKIQFHINQSLENDTIDF